MPTIVLVSVKATQAAHALAELLDDMTDEEVRTVWKYMGQPDEYPGPKEARAGLLLQAVRDGWVVEVRRSLDKAMRRAIVARDLRALRLLRGLWRVVQSAMVMRLRGRDHGGTPKAGHGATAPVRGSPFGRLALAMPGVPPPD